MTTIGRRIDVLFASLNGEECSAVEVAGALDIAVNTASQYLLAMTRSGQLARRRKGKGNTSYYVYTKIEGGSVQILTWDELPQWVRNQAVGEPEGSRRQRANHFWTVEQGAFMAWRKPERPAGVYAQHTGKLHNRTLPENIDPSDIVGWYDLPVWVKGSYANDEQLDLYHGYTWVRGSDSTYFAYTREGQYVGMWERE